MTEAELVNLYHLARTATIDAARTPRRASLAHRLTRIDWIVAQILACRRRGRIEWYRDGRRYVGTVVRTYRARSGSARVQVKVESGDASGYAGCRTLRAGEIVAA